MYRLINATSQDKKFCFSAHGVNDMMKCFDHRLIVNVNMHDQSNDVVFNTYIYDNEYRQRRV